MKQRQSNIELLRIFAIFFVLIVHTGIAAGGLLPSKAEINSSTIISELRIALYSVVVGGVDIFVLISGWFGINVSKKGLGKYIYQVAFLLWGIYIVFLVFGFADLSLDNIKIAFGIFEGYWFVMAYLGLYILSPILNAFTETAGKREYQLVLIAFYIFQTYFSWFWSLVDYYSGYSVVLFCGLYLTARYCRLYPVRILQDRPWATYFVAIFLLSVLSTIGVLSIGHPLKMLRYDNPLVILSALAILHGFKGIQIQNNLVNRLARCCFAVYIIHFNPLVFSYFRQGVVYLHQRYSQLPFLVYMASYLIFVYLACWVIDYVREETWNLSCKIFKF